MVDAGVINLDTSAVIEKHGLGHPCGSKNKPKDVSMVASPPVVPMKRCPGRPLGSNNKPKPSSSIAHQVVDANAAPRNASPPPPVNLFSFFVFAGTQCHEQQRVPLKFTNFMDKRELREAILHEESGGGTPYEVEVYMTVVARCTSRAAGPNLQRIMNCIKVSSWSSTTIVVSQSLM
jgi:hypothetical protein